MKKKKQIILIISIAIVAAGAIVLFRLTPRQEKAEPDKLHTPQEEITHVDDTDENRQTISIWHQFEAGSAEEGYLKGLIDEMELPPEEYDIETHTYPGMEMRNQLLSARQSGTLPIVAIIDPEWLPELAGLDILCALDTLDGYAGMSGQLLSGALETGRIKGHTYGLPFSVTARMLISNPDIQNTDEDGAYILGISGFDAQNIVPFLWGNGGALTNTGQTKATGYLDSDKNIEALENIIAMYNDNKIYDADGDDGGLVELFGSGKIGTVIADGQFIKMLAAAYPDFEYEVIHTSEDRGSYGATLSSTLLAVPKSGAPEIGWELVKKLTSEEAQIGFARLGIIPANNNALNSEAAAGADFAAIIDTLQTAKALPNAPQWREMDNEFSLAVIRITEGYKSVDQGIGDLARVWDALLY